MTLVGNLEALLVALQTAHIEELPPAARKRLSDLLYAGHVLVEMQVTGKAFQKVRPAAAAVEEPKSGVLAELRHGCRGD